MTRSGASPASPRHHAIAAHLHQEKAAPLHRRTVELELALTTDELAAAQASVRELSAALETAQARALAERDAVQHELDMERARASALEVKSNRLEEENKLLLEHVSVTRAALQEAEAEKQALKAERETRAEAERATAKAWLARQAAWADELGRLEGEAQFWQDCYRNVTKQEVHKPGGGRLAKPFAPMIEVGARSPVRGLRLPKAAAEVPVSPRPTTVLVK
jgi:hypothetical protein